MLAWVIQGAGYTPVTAGGAEGFALLTELADRVALVLLDLTMHDMDGFRFRELQRAQSRLAEVPTVVMSGRPVLPEERRRAARHRVRLEAGAHHRAARAHRRARAAAAGPPRRAVRTGTWLRVFRSAVSLVVAAGLQTARPDVYGPPAITITRSGALRRSARVRRIARTTS